MVALNTSKHDINFLLCHIQEMHRLHKCSIKLYSCDHIKVFWNDITFNFFDHAAFVFVDKIPLIGNTWHGLKQSHAWMVHTKRWLHFRTSSFDATSCLAKTNQLLNFWTYFCETKLVRHNLYVMFTVHITYKKGLERCQNQFTVFEVKCGRDNFWNLFLPHTLLEFDL